MKIFKGYEDFSHGNTVVTLGIFDGVHRGHKALIELLVERAAEYQGESVVITFFPHPRSVLSSNSEGVSLLTTMEEKAGLLAEAGVDNLVILDFNSEFSNMEACDFVSEILMKHLGTRYIIMGYDHRFGRRGEGDINRIRQCQGTNGLIIEQASPVIYNGEHVSSSLIRSNLLEGRADLAADLLGYYYPLTGTVIEGKKIGRLVGFPTANIFPGDKTKLIPADGVYAVWVVYDKKTYKGMLSIGSNPTVNDDAKSKSIEVHLFDFNQDIYGKDITVRFVRKIRDEKKFEGLAQLSAQMENDKNETIRLLKEF